mgnify:CR=1 FL=1
MGRVKQKNKLRHMLTIWAKHVMWKWKPDGLVKV